MPTGIVMSSSSQGATQEAIEKVLTENGYEPDKPEVTEPAAPVEPKREDFKTDEEFATAQEEFEAAQEEQQEKEEREEEERQRKQEEKHPRLTRRQRAVAAATKKLQDDLKAANDRIAALEGGKKPAAAAAAEELKAPKREDFKTDEEFEDAKFDYRYKQRRAKEAADAQRNAVETRLKENFENYQSQVAAFKEEHDDWDEVVNQPIPVHESVYLAIQEQENGAQVTYYLGKHPDYARRLAELTPLSAVMEIGRLAEKLKGGNEPKNNAGGTQKKPAPKPVPEPVRPVSTSATSSTLTSREAAQKRDFRAFKAAQRRGA